jgi:ABC-type uncharacterized transport system involved in gliding motility auxiliary subunit
MAGFFTGRTFRYGSNTFVAVLIVLGILVILNILATRYNRRFDLTEENIYSLSDQTITLLDSLEVDVRITAFFRDRERQKFEGLLKEYAYHSDRFSYRFVDPDRQPAEARKYKVKGYATTVIEAGDKQERLVTQTERDLTNGIAKAVREGRKIVYFLVGHGEVSAGSEDRNGYQKVREGLLVINYDVRDSLVLAQAEQVPEDCDLLIVAGPKKALLEPEVDLIRSYLEGGGAGLFMLDPGVASGLDRMLEGWTVRLGNDFVVDGSAAGRLFGLDYSMPVAAKYGKHPVTAKHGRLMTFFRMARSVSRVGTTVGVEAVELVHTSQQSWGETELTGEKPKFDPESEQRGPLSLAVAVKADPKRRQLRIGDAAGRKTRMVVFGDSDFANNQFFSAAGNGDLLLNAVSWLLEEGELIAIRAKERTFRPILLTPRDETWIFLLSLVLLPAVPVVAGIAVWWRRRSWRGRVEEARQPRVLERLAVWRRR